MSFNQSNASMPSLSQTSPASTNTPSPTYNSASSGRLPDSARGGVPPPPPFAVATRRNNHDEHPYQQGRPIAEVFNHSLLASDRNESVEINSIRPRPFPPGFVHRNNGSVIDQKEDVDQSQFQCNVSPAAFLPFPAEQHQSPSSARRTPQTFSTTNQWTHSGCADNAALDNTFNPSSPFGANGSLLAQRSTGKESPHQYQQKQARRDSVSASTHYSHSSSLARGFANVNVNDSRSNSRQSNGGHTGFPMENRSNRRDVPHQIVLVRSVSQESFQADNGGDDEDDRDRLDDIPMDSQGMLEQEWMSSQEVKRRTMSMDPGYLRYYGNDTSPPGRLYPADRGEGSATSPPMRGRVTNQPLVELKESDVLGGQGSGSSNRPTNKQYLHKVAELQEPYQKLDEKNSMGKTAIAMEVYNFVLNDLGGRFVHKLPTTQTDGLVVEMSKEEALEKIKRALRETRKSRPSGGAKRKHASCPSIMTSMITRSRNQSQ